MLVCDVVRVRCLCLCCVCVFNVYVCFGCDLLCVVAKCVFACACLRDLLCVCLVVNGVCAFCL